MKYTRFFAVILLSSIICTNALADVLYWKADIIPPPATIYYHGAMMKPAVKISATCLDTNANGCEFSSLIPGQFVTYEVRLIPQALLSQALNYDNWKNPLYSLNFLGISRTLPASAIMNVQTGEGFVLPQASDLQGANALDFYLPIPPTVTPGDYALAVWVAPAAGEIDTTSSLPVSDNLKITPTRPIKAPLNGALTHSGFNFPEFDPTTFRWNTGEAPLSAYPLNILPSAMTGPDQFYDPAYYVSTSGVPAWMSTTVAPSYLPPLLYFNSSLPKDPTCLLCIWLTLSPQTLAPGIYKNYIDFDHYFFPQVHLARPIWLAVDQPHLKGGESMTGQISSSTDVDEAVFDMLFEERMFFHLPFTSAGLKLKLAVKDLDGTVLYETESQPAPIVGGTGLVQATPTSRNPFIAPYTGTYQVQISAVTGTGPFKIGTKRALFRANEVLHSVDGWPPGSVWIRSGGRLKFTISQLDFSVIDPVSGLPAAVAEIDINRSPDNIGNSLSLGELTRWKLNFLPYLSISGNTLSVDMPIDYGGFIEIEGPFTDDSYVMDIQPIQPPAGTANLVLQ